MSDLITLPRAVVEQLVDPVLVPYVYIGRQDTWCLFCSASFPPDTRIDHAPSCPVRIVQEALANE